MSEFSPAAAGTRPLRLEPFRAVRYNPERVGDVAAVTCPPYDVIGDRVTAWEAADEHNMVRLILPRNGDAETRYAHAARDLHDWLGSGILVRDAEPALYVYEQKTSLGTALGLVGGVSLHDPGEGRILPHEDVFPGPVSDRTDLMRATRAQLEPILLTYEGGGTASDVVDMAAGVEPDLALVTDTGESHRLWRLTEHEQIAMIRADLAQRRALIADGHHRYAAYLAVRDRLGAQYPGAAFGLAMLVDAQRHPLQLGPIHRSIASCSLAAAVQVADRWFGEARPLGGMAPPDVEHELNAATGRGPAYALGDDRQWILLAAPDRQAIDAAMPTDHSLTWRELDASIACEIVLPELLGVDDADRRVMYHHQSTDAARRAADSAGVAVLLSPARHEDVMAVAADGERMPRKSTSFGPKPRTGLLMRLLADR